MSGNDAVKSLSILCIWVTMSNADSGEKKAVLLTIQFTYFRLCFFYRILIFSRHLSARIDKTHHKASDLT